MEKTRQLFMRCGRRLCLAVWATREGLELELRPVWDNVYRHTMDITISKDEAIEVLQELKELAEKALKALEESEEG